MELGIDFILIPLEDNANTNLVETGNISVRLLCIESILIPIEAET
jgi:hypothetical protein